jgi:hypothetical protein
MCRVDGDDVRDGGVLRAIVSGLLGPSAVAATADQHREREGERSHDAASAVAER